MNNKIKETANFSDCFLQTVFDYFAFLDSGTLWFLASDINCSLTHTSYKIIELANYTPDGPKFLFKHFLLRGLKETPICLRLLSLLLL